MRYWLFPLLIVSVFTACSRETAFEQFDRLDSRHERAVTNLRRVTLNENNQTAALISIIHLNPVDPELYGSRPTFFIALYDKKEKTLQDYNVTLNGSAPAAVARLDDNCSLRSLMPLNNPWNTYYQVLFQKHGDENLTLRFETGPSLKGEVTYLTDQ
jgi:hypothetical protein